MCYDVSSDDGVRVYKPVVVVVVAAAALASYELAARELDGEE